MVSNVPFSEVKQRQIMPLICVADPPAVDNFIEWPQERE
jgi:hypothetical protein